MIIARFFRYHRYLMRGFAARVVLWGLGLTLGQSVLANPQPLFEIYSPAAKVAPHHAYDGRQVFQLNLNQLQHLSAGQIVKLSLPDGRSAAARLQRTAVPGSQNDEQSSIFSLLDGSGSVEIVSQNNRPKKIRITEVQGRLRVYEATLDGAASGELLRQNAHRYFCIDLPKVATAEFLDSVPTSVQLAQTPDVATLQTLQSKPSANKVLFLNYWGGTLSGTIWNDDYMAGGDIVYSPYSGDADSATFSSSDRYEMWLGWRETAEDYAPFDVNITTDISIYNATASNHRSMIIATTTDAWFGLAGGVANLDSFGNDYSGVGWAWNNAPDTLGQTMAHEAGHQMNLSHDGNQSSQYDAGHNNWGPIMGAPFGKWYVQWSQGEYAGANNQEDDLQIIKLKLGEDFDSIGDTELAAMPISSTSYIESVIEPMGLNGGIDTDVYRFDLQNSENVSINIAPLLGAEAEQLGSNLSLDALLSDGVQMLASSFLSGDPQSNVLVFNAQLNAGTYYLTVTALTPDADWVSGFGEYGNGGLYSISVASSVAEPDITPGLTVDDVDVFTGQLVTFSAQVQNIGSGQAGASVLHYYESPDAVISPADAEILTRPVMALAAQQSQQIVAQIEASSVAGSTYYGVCVDSVLNETVVANNCSMAIPFNINALALDLDIAAAVEQTGLSWLRGGDRSFFRQTSISMNDGDAAQSGDIADDEYSYIQVQRNTPGWLRFQWKVSSEDGFDYLRFIDNGVEINAISGEQDWTSLLYELSAGTHSLQWAYDKDPFTQSGLDAGWIDQVEFLDRRLSIDSFDAVLDEGDSGSVTFEYTVLSEGLSSAAASVDYSVTGSGANPADAADFGGAFPTGTLVFAADETQRVISIDVQGDAQLESNEGFTLQLSAFQGAIGGAILDVQSTINNDELDTDADGIIDVLDNCPMLANSNQLDSDGDLQGDVCDPDDDNDTVLDADDNCPVDANISQQDICSMCFPVSSATGPVVVICL